MAVSSEDVGATTLLAAVALLNLHLSQQVKAGNPPSPRVMKMVPPIARTSLVLVLIGIAVLTTFVTAQSQTVVY